MPQDKLQSLLKMQGLMTGAQLRETSKKVERLREEGTFEIDAVVPGEVIGEGDDGFYLVRTEYDADTGHGLLALGEALNTASKHVALSACDPELADFDPRSAIFIDTETTGLAGGAGTVTFLVGVGYFVGDTFRVDQCFMRDYDDEEPMLHYLGELFANAGSVVSYNGKSFDLPLLRTRFITNRIPFRLEGTAHFDLVHAARRFYKKRLGDCSLGNIEREVLGIDRVGDVDSAEIPRIWLDYLFSRDARDLEAVFYHHKTDILSLVTLTALLSRALDVPGGEGFEHHEDRLSLVRIHYKQKNYEEVLTLSEGLIKTMDGGHLRHECWEMMGFAAKRLERWETMEGAWQSLIDEFPSTLTARVELAKHHEHRTRNLREAQRLCREALNHATGAGAPSPATTIRYRLERIEGKIARATRPAE